MNYKNIQYEHYDSVYSFINTLRNRKENNEEMRNEKSSEDGDSEFTKTNSLEEAYDLVENGYSELLPGIKKQVQNNLNIFYNKFSKKVNIKNSVEGQIPNVPNYLMGLPNNMMKINKENNKYKTISIIYLNSAGGWFETQDYLENGSLLLSAISLLERHNIRVELNIAFKASTENRSLFSLDPPSKEANYTLGVCKIKGYNDRLNLLKTCFPIAHPSWQRRLGFKWLETYPNLKGNYKNGYGCTVEGEGVKYIQEFLENKNNKKIKAISFYDIRKIIKNVDKSEQMKELLKLLGMEIINE